MKKRFSILLFLAFFLFSGVLSSCLKDDPLLVTSNIKNITRNEFYNWLEAKKLEKDTILDSKEKQKLLLESMALEYFIMDRAKAEGIDKTRRFSTLKERIRESTLYKYYIVALTDQATFNEPAIRVSYIFLPLSRYKNDPNDETKKIKLESNEVMASTANLVSKAKEIIQRLDNGDTFEKLAAEFSEDSNKKHGGDLGFIVDGMMPAYFFEPACSLMVGEYTKTPVMTPKGIYILKLTDRADLTEKNMGRIIEDKSQRDRTKVFLTQKYKSEYLSKLMDAEDVVFLYKKGKTYNSTDTLFRVGAQEYTEADIEKIIEKKATPEEIEKIYAEDALAEKARTGIVNEYFRYLVWSRDAERLGIEKKPEYLKEVKEKEINLILSEFIRNQASKEVFISDQEIMEAYENEKNGKYSETAKENGEVVNKPIPYEFIRDQIVDDLKEEAQYQRAEVLKKKLLEKYEYKVNEKALIGS